MGRFLSVSCSIKILDIRTFMLSTCKVVFTLWLISILSTVKFCSAALDDEPRIEINMLSLLCMIILRRRTWFELVMVIRLLSESPKLFLASQSEISTSLTESIARRLWTPFKLFVWKFDLIIRTWLARNIKILLLVDDVMFVKIILLKLISVFKNWRLKLWKVEWDILVWPSVVVMLEEATNVNPVNCVEHNDKVNE